MPDVKNENSNVPVNFYERGNKERVELINTVDTCAENYGGRDFL